MVAGASAELEPERAAVLLPELTSAAAALFEHSAAGQGWPAVAATHAAAGGVATLAFADAVSASLLALHRLPSLGAGAEPRSSTPLAEKALDGAMRLLLEAGPEGPPGPPGGPPAPSTPRLRPGALRTCLLHARTDALAGPPLSMLSLLRLCAAALAGGAPGDERASWRQAARGSTLLAALLVGQPGALLLAACTSHPQLAALARPSFAAGVERFRASALRHAPFAADVGVVEEEGAVASAALRLASMRLCSAMARAEGTRAATAEALKGVLGAAVLAQPPADFARTLGLDSRHPEPPWLTRQVDSLVCGLAARSVAAEQAVLLASLLAAVLRASPDEAQAAASLAAAVSGTAQGVAHLEQNVATLLKCVVASAEPADLPSLFALSSRLRARLRASN